MGACTRRIAAWCKPSPRARQLGINHLPAGRRTEVVRDEAYAVAEAPDGIVLRRHRDLDGRGWHLWVRRGLLAALALFVVLALLNVFGQRPSGAQKTVDAATLKVYAP